MQKWETRQPPRLFTYIHINKLPDGISSESWEMTLSLRIRKTQSVHISISAVSPLCLPYQNVYYDLVENLSLKTYPRVCINHHPCRFYSRGYKSIKTFSRAKRKPQVLGALILFHFISRRHFHNNRNRGTVFSREIKWMRYEVKARLKFYTTD